MKENPEEYKARRLRALLRVLDAVSEERRT